MRLVKQRLIRETKSVNEAHNHSTMPTSGNIFEHQEDSFLLTTDNKS